MNFASDNWAGAHKSISDNLTRHSVGFQPAYGTSSLDQSVEEKICSIFERDASIFFVATGTAANALSVAAASNPGGVTFCHSGAHMYEDEAGAPEFYSNARLRPVQGREGRIDKGELENAVAHFSTDHVHFGQPSMISITQSTELGTVYSLDDIQAISKIAKNAKLPIHMDGARFANALVSLDSTPAEMSWKAGVDMLSFGGTKNGCWCAEALIVFDPVLAGQMAYHRKRAGHLFSKTRFVTAQFEAYLSNGLWLELARHSNAMTGKLAAAIRTSPDIRLLWEPQANEIFAVAKTSHFEALKSAGLLAAPWVPPVEHAHEIAKDEVLFRLVTSFANTDDHIQAFEESLQSL